MGQPIGTPRVLSTCCGSVSRLLAAIEAPWGVCASSASTGSHRGGPNRPGIIHAALVDPDGQLRGTGLTARDWPIGSWPGSPGAIGDRDSARTFRRNHDGTRVRRPRAQSEAPLRRQVLCRRRPHPGFAPTDASSASLSRTRLRGSSTVNEPASPTNSPVSGPA